jgi:hypothetical protein
MEAGMALLFDLFQGIKKGTSFPESIDTDGKDNLYYSEILSGSLYRFQRDSEKNTLNPNAEALVKGFKSVHGISIDKDNNHIYFSVQMIEKNVIIPKIISFSLEIFEDEKVSPQLPLNPNDLKKYSSQFELRWLEWVLPKPANGVEFVSPNSIYYSFHHLLGDLPFIKSKGHLSKIEVNSQQGLSILTEFPSANGLSRDPDEPDILFIAFSSKNAIGRYDIRSKSKLESPIHLGDGGPSLIGHGPDGVFCSESGDLFIACFASGKILVSRKNDGSYATPQTIKEGLGCPTDLVKGISSDGTGNSVYVTTMKPLFKGKVVEIPILYK